MKKHWLMIVWLMMAGGVLAQPSPQLSGRVTDQQGEGIAFAIVKIGKGGITADARGYFSYSGHARPAMVWVQALGFVPQQVSVPSSGELLVVLAEETTELHEVVVTATRTSQPIDNVPVPVLVIGQEKLANMGALRVSEVLMEQTGLQLTSDHGTGVMMQGLPSEYILFLIDGEPVIGRTAGTLELDRLAVDNIARIEILKGPSSSLYGSEAMAGVVNIITKKAGPGWDYSLRSRVRSFATTDLSAQVGYGGERLKATAFVNRVSTAGYDLTEETASMTAPPYTAYTVAPKLSYALTDDLSISLNGKFYTEAQQNVAEVLVGEELEVLDEAAQRQDWSLMPSLSWHVQDQHHVQVRGYLTGYQTESALTYATGELYEGSYFQQRFGRAEAQYDWYHSDRHITTAGLGFTLEGVEATRYAQVSPYRAGYGYLQHQWIPTSQLNVIVGGRFDAHNAYASRFSPKMALGYTLSEAWKVQASVSGGYKAPDFRQLLLDFTNPVAGYTVLGANLVQERLAELQAQGQIATVLLDPTHFQTIKAESSLAYNLGLTYTPNPNWKWCLSGFRNQIRNLIDTAPIARKTNGQNVFSYFNFDEVVTQGLEVNGRYMASQGLEVSAGYQYLDSRNLADLERIAQGEVFRRNPETNRTELVTLADYGGLPNRSRHTGNAKLSYTSRRHHFNLALRSMYRGAWGLGDANGNGLIDAASEFAPGYWLVNLAGQKELWNWLTLEGGVNNLLHQTNPYEPSLAGRIWFAGLRIHWNTSQ